MSTPLVRSANDMETPLSKNDCAYVRAAKPSEFARLAAVQGRAFAQDALMNWLGSVTAMIPRNPEPSSTAMKGLASLTLFQASLATATHLAGGNVMVVVVPSGSGAHCESEEKIVAYALWLPPGKSVGVNSFLRAGFYRVLPAWGWTGFKRAVLDFQPSCNSVTKADFKKRKMDINQSWHLEGVGTDPGEEGKGYCAMLMKDAFARSDGAAITLEATSAKSRDIYLHWGFELNSELRFGAGKVNAQGLPPQNGTEGEGIPIWVMTKW